MRSNILYKTFLLSFLSFCIISVAFAQNKETIIAGIKSEFQRINADKSLKELELNNDEITSATLDNGASLTAFYKDNIVSKISVFVGLSFGIQEYEYYFKDGRLFFVFEKEQAFAYDNKTSALDQTKTTTTFEARYYLDNTKLIDLKSKGAKRFEQNSKSSIKEILKTANEYMVLVKRRLNRIK